MKEYLATLVRTAKTPAHARNIAREYVQARILGTLQRAGAFIPLAFHGGTALRFLYLAPRWSEDLHFALERAADQYDFRAYLRAVRGELEAETYTVRVALRDRTTVHSAFVRLPGLLYELGLSSHRDETLSVKLEVDTQPPAGAGLATTVVRRHVLLHVQHHDRESLLAGKLHALLQRPYLKGRDLFDLLWYLSDPEWPAPNLTLLNNALRQTGWPGRALTAETWREAVWARLRGVDWARAVADVQPFLDSDADATLLTRETFMRLLGA